MRKLEPKDPRKPILEITLKERKPLKNIDKEKDESLEGLVKGFPPYSSPRSFLKREKRLPAASAAQSKGIRLIFKTRW